MMKEFSSDLEVVRLLDEMEGRVRASAVLAEEWRKAQEAWPSPVMDKKCAQRFREWFLLERASPALGIQPAAAWSPPETGVPESDPWARLLESFFGIFRPVLVENEIGFEDLWSGRVIQLSGIVPSLAADELLHGRVAPAGDECHALLPGWRLTTGEDLAQAVADDLQRARAAHPRARLSQLECERLWASHSSLPAAETAAAPDPEAFLAELERLLRQDPNWPMERALEILEQDGPEVLLEQLAFETNLPLDPLRANLAELRAATLAAQSFREADGQQSPAEIEAAAVAAALELFDRELATGSDSKTAWSKLEAALDLEGGPLESLKAPWLEEGEPLGPTALPGLKFWVEAWAWEQSQLHAAPLESELEAARSFAAFVEALRTEPTDATEIVAKDLWAYLASSTDSDTLESRRSNLRSFLLWARNEQDAALPLEELESPTSPTWRRLAESVRLNSENRSLAGRGTQAAKVWKISPIQVLTESQEGAPVLGFPESAATLVRSGDTLAGRWEAGAFRLCAWFPGV